MLLSLLNRAFAVDVQTSDDSFIDGGTISTYSVCYVRIYSVLGVVRFIWRFNILQTINRIHFNKWIHTYFALFVLKHFNVNFDWHVKIEQEFNIKC